MTARMLQAGRIRWSLAWDAGSLALAGLHEAGRCQPGAVYESDGVGAARARLWLTASVRSQPSGGSGRTQAGIRAPGRVTAWQITRVDQHLGGARRSNGTEDLGVAPTLSQAINAGTALQPGRCGWTGGA